MAIVGSSGYFEGWEYTVSPARSDLEHEGNSKVGTVRTKESSTRLVPNEKGLATRHYQSAHKYQFPTMCLKTGCRGFGVL
jgi:hypothetical protein